MGGGEEFIPQLLGEGEHDFAEADVELFGEVVDFGWAFGNKLLWWRLKLIVLLLG